jgi:hypothetical protein
VEREREALKPHLLHTGSRVLTDPAFLQHLTSRLAPKEAAEPEGKKLALGRLTGPREVGLLDPHAEAEDEELADIDLLEPDGLTSAKLRGEDERVAPLSPSDGED